MRLRSALVPLFLGAATVVGACGPSDGDGDNGGDGDGDSGGTPDAGDDPNRPDARVRPDADPNMPPPPPADGCTKMDIVFVVDDSASMEGEQRELAENFPEFARVLDEYTTRTGEKLDYRVGLTTTGRTVYRRTLLGLAREANGDDGEFRINDEMTKAWIETADMDRREWLAELARVGTDGGHIEMPLETARLALSLQHEAGGPNAGFLREDALLALVMLTDEEDSSTARARLITDPLPIGDAETNLAPLVEAPQNFVDFFDQLKGGRGRWATAVIAGDGMGRPRCGGDNIYDGAEDAPRLKEFVQKTGQNAIFRTICTDDFSGALKDALDTFQLACDGLPPVD